MARKPSRILTPEEKLEIRENARERGFKQGWWIEERTVRDRLDWRALAVSVGAVAVGYLVGRWWSARRGVQQKKPSSSLVVASPSLVDGLL